MVMMQTYVLVGLQVSMEMVTLLRGGILSLLIPYYPPLYPPPYIGHPLNGDVHFDDAEDWTFSIRSGSTQPIDLVTIAAHEIGHALGLRHSYVPNSLMNKYYTRSHRYLGTDDIERIRALYGCRKPEILFSDTSLNDALQSRVSNPIDHVNANTTIRDGDRIPISVSYSTSFSWKYSKPSINPDPRRPESGVEIFTDSHEYWLPYSRCNRTPPSNSLVGAYDLIDHYFVPPSQEEAFNNDYSPAIHVSGSGLVEVEVTASNECSCTTAVNNYYVLPPAPTVPQSVGEFNSIVTISPNPADDYLAIRVQSPDGRWTPDAPNPRPNLPNSEYPPPDRISIQDAYEYNYTLTIYRITRYRYVRVHMQSFRLNSLVGIFSPSSNIKDIRILTGSWLEGHYTVSVHSQNERANKTYSTLIEH